MKFNWFYLHDLRNHTRRRQLRYTISSLSYELFWIFVLVFYNQQLCCDSRMTLLSLYHSCRNCNFIWSITVCNYFTWLIKNYNNLVQYLVCMYIIIPFLADLGEIKHNELFQTVTGNSYKIPPHIRRTVHIEVRCCGHHHHIFPFNLIPFKKFPIELHAWKCTIKLPWDYQIIYIHFIINMHL